MDFLSGIIKNWELISFFLSLGGIVIARYWPALTKESQKWAKLIGGKEKILEVLLMAATLSEYNDEQKKDWAAKQLKEIAANNGCNMPDAVANLLVEFFYNQYKKLINKNK